MEARFPGHASVALADLLASSVDMADEPILAADGPYFPPLGCACRAGVRLSLTRAEIKGCLEGPYLSRGDAIGRLTDGQLDRLFPGAKESRCGADHRRAARQLRRMAALIPPSGGADEETDRARKEIRELCAPLAWRALCIIAEQSRAVASKSEPARLRAILRAATGANLLRGVSNPSKLAQNSGRRDEREDDGEG